MAGVTLTDEQYATMKRAVDFLQEAATKPETRRGFEKIAKTLRPEIETTEDIAASYAAPHIEELNATRAKLDEFLAAQTKREQDAADAAADRRLNEAFERQRAAGYTEEGIGKIKQLMIDRGIADPEAAAALFDRQNPKPSDIPGAWEPDHWNIRTDAVENDVEGLFRDPDKWADKATYSILAEMRGAK